MNLDLLKEQNPCPKLLAYLYNKLSVELSEDIAFNSNLHIHIASMRFCAQSVINRCDENSRPAFEMFRAAGLPVTWPNVFKRAWFAFQRIRREAAEKARHEAEAASSAAILAEEQTKQFAALAQLKIAQSEAETARHEARAQSEKKLQMIIAAREGEKQRKRENGEEIVRLCELIEERKKENRKEDGTNDSIRRYNALVEKGDHDLKPSEWTKMRFLSLDEE